MATSTISQIASAAIVPSGGEFIEMERSNASFRTTAKRLARVLTLFANEFSKNQNLDSTTLSIVASAVDISFLDNGNCKLTLTQNVSANSPTDLIDGRSVLLKVTQDGTGGRNLTFHSDYNFANHDSTINTGANKITWYSFWTDGTNVYARKIWEDT